MKLLKKYRYSLNFRITMITIVFIILGMLSMILYTNASVAKLTDKTLGTMDRELYYLIDEYYTNYINEISLRIEENYNGYMEEIQILGQIFQEVFDKEEDLARVLSVIKEDPYFKDQIIFNGKWGQNTSDEPTTVFLGSCLYDDNGEIKPDVQSAIDKTAIFDLIMPAFYKHGKDKMQVYYTGGEDEDYTRMAPWADIGHSVYDIYPEIYDRPIWDVFNPGLIEDWTERMLEKGIGNPNLIRVSHPIQDGITDGIVLSLTHPIWDRKTQTFKGHVVYDITIESVIEQVESIKISNSGFAMLIQSDGNIFAINEKGASVLGLKAVVEDTNSSASGTGFKSFGRYIQDSTMESVRNLKFLETNEIKEIDLNGETYLFIHKKMNSFVSWTPQSGFYDEAWTLAFLVPRDEIYKMYINSENQIKNDQDIAIRQQVGIGVVILGFLVVFITLYNTRMTSKLNALTQKVKQMKANNYQVDFDIHSEDEIGKLASAFEDMQHEIQDSLSRLKVQNELLKNEIDERIKKDRIIDYLENFDSQTDLLNKKALLNMLKDLSLDHDQTFASLIIIGLDEFRKINDAYTFKVGDEIIQALATKLDQVAQSHELLFRIGGDEFAILFKGKDLNELILKVEEISALFKKTFSIRMHDVTLSASIGISTFPHDTSDTLDLFKYANIAMNHAKETNRGGSEYYNEAMNYSARNRIEMIHELNQAIENNELSLNFQPIVEIETNKIAGVEVLLRWRSKKFGHVSPTVFIKLAEQSKLIVKIGSWVLEEALKALGRFEAAGFGHIEMAINISVIQLMQHDLVEETRILFDKYPVKDKQITFEVTEGLFINDFEKVRTTFDALEALGVQISIDDFGTGYSSLSYLKNLAINRLKIDRSFISELHDKAGGEITNAVIALANNLNLRVIAEGVENVEQLEHLRERGCDEAQGFLFSKPLDFEHCIEFLKQDRL
ncbi:bifunctional diguanylate cyclase/phosphodiesterase [Fusibacter ferrireducens]|uniref:EAL domain-containing protein n=1 Tax=Fusibacter ferrireducens TaxID=2785058 RepID=A0ABR9ZZN2_9FIRM|nr:EAL domain-containing protein [Fusibacter ferrireducens]MBF4695903.1 EAL domain-containing protein [Fusibacter ferrireducens]